MISKFQTIFTIVMKITEIFWSEGYCYYLDFLRIAYYPVTNRYNRANSGPRFSTVSRIKISILGHNKSKELTVFFMYQLELLYKHFRMPVIHYPNLIAINLEKKKHLCIRWYTIVWVQQNFNLVKFTLAVIQEDLLIPFSVDRSAYL